jgi:hypothetical protein
MFDLSLFSFWVMLTRDWEISTLSKLSFSFWFVFLMSASILSCRSSSRIIFLESLKKSSWSIFSFSSICRTRLTIDTSDATVLILWFSAFLRALHVTRWRSSSANIDSSTWYRFSKILSINFKYRRVWSYEWMFFLLTSYSVSSLLFNSIIFAALDDRNRSWSSFMTSHDFLFLMRLRR